MNTRKKVSITIPVYEAIEDMGLGHARYFQKMLRWAVRADDKIGSYYSYKKKISVLDVIDCHASLPCDVVGVLGLIRGDQGCDCGLIFDNVVQFNQGMNLAVTCPCAYTVSGNIVNQCSELTYGIQDNTIVFNQNLNGQQITVQYLGYQLDDKGYPLVNDTHITAISQYIKMMLYKESITNIVLPQVSRPDRLDAEREWHRLCRQARGEDGEPSPSERQQLVDMFNDPLSGIGLITWSMRNNYYFLNYGR